MGTDTRWTHTPEKNIARRPPERGCAPAASGRGSATGRATLFQTQTPCDHHRGNTSGKPRQCRPTGFSWKRPPNPRHPQPTCYHTADSQQEPANSQEPAISQNKTHTRTCIWHLRVHMIMQDPDNFLGSSKNNLATHSRHIRADSHLHSTSTCYTNQALIFTGSPLSVLSV